MPISIAALLGVAAEQPYAPWPVCPEARRNPSCLSRCTKRKPTAGIGWPGVRSRDQDRRRLPGRRRRSDRAEGVGDSDLRLSALFERAAGPRLHGHRQGCQHQRERGPHGAQAVARPRYPRVASALRGWLERRPILPAAGNQRIQHPALFRVGGFVPPREPPPLVPGTWGKPEYMPNIIDAAVAAGKRTVEKRNWKPFGWPPTPRGTGGGADGGACQSRCVCGGEREKMTVFPGFPRGGKKPVPFIWYRGGPKTQDVNISKRERSSKRIGQRRGTVPGDRQKEGCSARARDDRALMPPAIMLPVIAAAAD